MPYVYHFSTKLKPSELVAQLVDYERRMVVRVGLGRRCKPSH